MSLELWLAFVAAYTVLSVIPGPSVLMVTSLALTRGTSAALFCILGDLLGGVVLMVLSVFGLAAVLLASATLFQIVKWAGVIYLAYLGYRQIVEARRQPSSSVASVPDRSAWSSLRTGFLTGVLNPKAIIFYAAFVSQFINPAENLALQFFVLLTTSTLVVGLVLTCYAIAAARLRKMFESARAKRVFGYAGGSFMLGSSALIAATR